MTAQPQLETTKDEKNFLGNLPKELEQLIQEKFFSGSKSYIVPDNQVVACEISSTDDHVDSLNDGNGTVEIIPSGEGLKL